MGCRLKSSLLNSRRILRSHVLRVVTSSSSPVMCESEGTARGASGFSISSRPMSQIAYRAPDPRKTVGIVFAKILKSSHRDRWSMYCLSSSVYFSNGVSLGC